MKETLGAIARGIGRWLILIGLFVGLVLGANWWSDQVATNPSRTISITVLVGMALWALAGLINWELDEVKRQRRVAMMAEDAPPSVAKVPDKPEARR